MIEFFETYKTELFYSLLVVIGVLLLRLLTKIFHKWLLRKEQKRFPGIKPNALNLVKRILNALWWVLGVMGISFLLFGEAYEKFQSNFRIILYLGLVAVITIVIASSVNIWFRKKVEQKTAVKDDPTAFKFLRYVAVFVVYTVGILLGLLAFPALKGVAQTALGGAGVIALIAGVASQEALANLVG